MTLTFLAISRRERGAVTITTDTATAQLAADDALASAEGQIMANTLAATNPYNFGLLVSTNYINPEGYVAALGANPTNINYYYQDQQTSLSGTNPVSGKDLLQLLANLQYLPRAPVLIGTNDPIQGRFYLDLNRNQQFDTNGIVDNFVPNLGGGVVTDGTTNFQVGDPEWIGVLQHPDQPYGPNNPFVARYAFVAVPIGNALDLNYTHNQAITKAVYLSQAGSLPTGVAGDGYFRNEGVGPWEINLAAFLADLNTNEWLPVFPPANGYYAYDEPGNFNNLGIAFEDALSLLSYRYGYNYTNLASVDNLYGGSPIGPDGYTTFRNDNIDGYSDGPLQTGFQLPGDSATPLNDDPSLPWSGADNPTNYFDLQALFDPNKTSVAFTNRLQNAGGNPVNSTYNRYTYYRLLSQMGVESAPEQDQINLNYSNAFASTNLLGVVTNIAILPGAETNFTPWTPLHFFTIAADKMLRTYSQEWITESPSNYVATYGMVTNISTDPAYTTNVPVPFGISDIPVVISNRFVYTPAIQRVLQLAANMYDATTNNLGVNGNNRDYPSVFRPIFWVTNDIASGYTNINIYINGYEPVGSFFDASGQVEVGTVTGPNDPQFDLPVDVGALASGSYGFGIFTNLNVYGVPWIIGAKKSFPNFNEFAMESVFQLTRKLEAWRPNTNDFNYNDYRYYQMFNLSVSNEFGVECWNSYSNNFLDSVAIYVNCTNTCLFTNDEGFSTSLGSMISAYFPITSVSNNDNGWPGYNPLSLGPPLFLTPASFQIPLDTNVAIITNSMYRFNVGGNYEEPGHGGPYLTTNLNLPYETGVNINGNPYPQPHWWLITSNDIRVIILDTPPSGPDHVIDYVQLSGPNSVRDLTGEIMTNYDTPYNTIDPSGTEQFNTNFANGLPVGLLSQIGVCLGNYTTVYPPWNESDTQKQVGIDGFLAFFGYTGFTSLTPEEQQAVNEARMTNAMQAPYTPTATVVQHVDWQVNDPLVHYMANDLNWPGANRLDKLPDNLTNELGGLGKLNLQYKPWGGYPSAAPDANAYNLALKDPLVRRSDDWDFPTYKLPTIGWLGRVHRGTPWQTVYLKSADILEQTNASGVVIGPNTWAQWTGDTELAPSLQYYDAINTAPVQDRLLFDLFTTAFNDNATRGQLSVNVGASDPNNPQSGLAAWSALFSGIVVPTNTIGGYTIIDPAGPAGVESTLGELVANINYTRTNFVNVDELKGTFEHVGDILAAPALTVSNQWILLSNTNTISGISDEMYEWLPQQVMSLLRVSGTPQSPMRYVIYSYGQALKPAPNGIYTGGGPFFGMVTNYQVVAEAATRAVVNFNSVRTNLVTIVVTNNGIGIGISTNWIVQPVVTNNNAVMQYHGLPPE